MKIVEKQRNTLYLDNQCLEKFIMIFKAADNILAFTINLKIVAK